MYLRAEDLASGEVRKLRGKALLRVTMPNLAPSIGVSHHSDRKASQAMGWIRDNWPVFTSLLREVQLGT